MVYDVNNIVIKIVIIISLMLYFIGYVLFLNNLNNTDNNNDETKNTFINIYLWISFFLSLYLIYYYSNLYKTDKNFMNKIIYGYLIITCILNIIGLSIIFLSDEYYNNNLNQIKISNNNIFKYSFAFVVIFTISNVFRMIYYYNNNNNNKQLIEFTKMIFAKHYNTYLKSKQK